MALTVVTHATPQPALFGAMAAVVAHTLQQPLCHLPCPAAAWVDADAAQWVSACGHLLPSGLAWYERLSGLPIGAPQSLEQVLALAARQPVVLANHPGITAASPLSQLAAQHGVTLHHLTVAEQANGELHLEQDPGAAQFGRWQRDRFGRLARAPLPSAGPAAFTLALIGTPHEHLAVYPAALAALGDAIDACGGEVAVKCLGAQHFALSELAGIDGIVLPGGSDMANVAGQLRAAHYALAQRLPILGLCLGMQSMATAFAQSLGLPANLEEVDASAELKSFVAMAGSAPLPAHRLGERSLRVADPHLAELLGAAPRLRCNHRYYLNPQLHPALLEGGLRITATDASGLIADAIDVPAQPFYRGMQGHPEQGSRPGSPHPLIRAFVEAVKQRPRAASQHPV
ncbi:gamma-glutamyl-gamma-aminobutyrate hydrolase family protein [Pseudomonas sp. NPDC007930]|uniref:glutamine amidotransferase-related protein n=1 Tax=Pseudomonas sp. NPDC007930 TaxID=3364417 RepID=UPI0036E176B5